MDSTLKVFLAGRTQLTFETSTWGDLDLEIRYYGSDELPPDHLVTSVRVSHRTPPPTSFPRP